MYPPGTEGGFTLSVDLALFFLLSKKKQQVTAKEPCRIYVTRATALQTLRILSIQEAARTWVE